MATVVNILDSTREVFGRVFTDRGAPSDHIRMAMSLTITRDTSGEDVPGILIFIAVADDDDGDRETTCTTIIPCQALAILPPGTGRGSLVELLPLPH